MSALIDEIAAMAAKGYEFLGFGLRSHQRVPADRKIPETVYVFEIPPYEPETTPMAEEQAIPVEIVRAARELLRQLAWIAPEEDLRTEPVARALMAAELRGRTEQIEADARIAEDVTRQHCAGGYFVMTGPAGIGRSIATAIRSQS